jgi:hypothetical protein
MNEYPDLAQRHSFAELPVPAAGGVAVPARRRDEERSGLVQQRGRER